MSKKIKVELELTDDGPNPLQSDVPSFTGRN